MNQYSEKYVDQLKVEIAEQQEKINQQADHIAELEKELEKRKDLCTDLVEIGIEQANQIAELRKNASYSEKAIESLTDRIVELGNEKRQLEKQTDDFHEHTKHWIFECKKLEELLKEARKIIRASSQRNLVKDWDRRTTEILSTVNKSADMPTNQNNCNRLKPRLSDEEIEKIWQKSNQVIGKMGLMYVKEIILPFARAIEERILGK